MGNGEAITARDMVMLFNYATRLVAIEPDAERIYEQALEALAVFAESSRVAFYRRTREEGMLRLEGVFSDNAYRPVKLSVPYPGTPLDQVITEKQYAIFPASADSGPEWVFPSFEVHPSGFSCLCLPVAGLSNNIEGVVAIEKEAEGDWSVFNIQTFISFTTVIAIALENSKLYKLATIDGLTGLFVRTFFEIRLQEEIARIRRHGGILSVLMVDIDKFKNINDIHGHQYGDMVLKGIASVLETNVRKGVDVPCRYGGDEFTVLISGAGARQSLALAERIKEQCETHVFKGAGGKEKVTISGGIASMDSDHILGELEIVRRADQMLYRAKNEGRDRIRAWTNPKPKKPLSTASALESPPISSAALRSLPNRPVSGLLLPSQESAPLPLRGL